MYIHVENRLTNGDSDLTFDILILETDRTSDEIGTTDVSRTDVVYETFKHLLTFCLTRRDSIGIEFTFKFQWEIN